MGSVVNLFGALRITVNRTGSLFPDFDDNDTGVALECDFCKTPVETTNLQCDKCKIELCMYCFESWSMLHLTCAKKYKLQRSQAHPEYNERSSGYQLASMDEDYRSAINTHYYYYRHSVPFDDEFCIRTSLKYAIVTSTTKTTPSCVKEPTPKTDSRLGA